MNQAAVADHARYAPILKARQMPEEPAVRHIDLGLADQLAFRSNAKQVTHEQRPEQHRRIERLPAIVGTIVMRDTIVDETEVNRPGDLLPENSSSLR